MTVSSGRWASIVDCHPLLLHAQNNFCQSWIYFQMTHHLSVDTSGKDASFNSHNLHLCFLCSIHVPHLASCQIHFSLTFYVCAFCICDLLLIVDYWTTKTSDWDHQIELFLCFLSICFIFWSCFYSFQSLQLFRFTEFWVYFRFIYCLCLISTCNIFLNFFGTMYNYWWWSLCSLLSSFFGTMYNSLWSSLLRLLSRMTAALDHICNYSFVVSEHLHLKGDMYL